MKCVRRFTEDENWRVHLEIPIWKIAGAVNEGVKLDSEMNQNGGKVLLWKTLEIEQGFLVSAWDYIYMCVLCVGPYVKNDLGFKLLGLVC